MYKKILSAIFILILLAGVAFALLYTPLMQKRYPLKYEDIIMKYSEEYNIPPEYISAVIFCESSFREDAVSHAGATGLMQLMPDTFEWLSNSMGEDFPGGDITDPESNIACGCYYLSYMQELFGSLETAIAGYNAGNGRVSGWLKEEAYSSDGVHLHTIPFKETSNYVNRVLKSKDIYKDLYFKEK